MNKEISLKELAKKLVLPATVLAGVFGLSRIASYQDYKRDRGYAQAYYAGCLWEESQEMWRHPNIYSPARDYALNESMIINHEWNAYDRAVNLGETDIETLEKWKKSLEEMSKNYQEAKLKYPNACDEWLKQWNN